MRKKVFSCFLLMSLVLNLITPAYATEASYVDEDVNFAVSAVIVISDPSTGEKWEWELESPHIKELSENNASRSINSVNTTEVSVDVGEYMLRTMAPPVETERVLYDDITLTVGLEYSIDAQNNMIAVYRAFGSAPHNNMYSATNKEFFYANPMVFYTIEQHPTQSSWSYTTDSTPGAYIGELPPFALLNCRISVTGMESSYRDVSVICKLDWF